MELWSGTGTDYVNYVKLCFNDSEFGMIHVTCDVTNAKLQTESLSYDLTWHPFGCPAPSCHPLRARFYGLPQSRGRVYIIMVQSNLMSAYELKALGHIISAAMPAVMTQRATVAQVCAHVTSVSCAMDQPLTYPPDAKD